MMQIQEYAKPAALDEAYEILKKRRTNRILGGCTFLKRTGIRIGTAVDLSDCGLSYIQDDHDVIRIGAYTTLRELETNDIIRRWCGDMLSEPLAHLIGVQLKNQITIGAHVASRYGFSDLIPAFMALDATAVFHGRGAMPLISYMELKNPERDILTEIEIPKVERKGKIQMMRLSWNDYSIFSLSVSRCKDAWIIVAGNLPGRAQCAYDVMNHMNTMQVTKTDAKPLAAEVAQSYTYGSNYRGSAWYRRELCEVFARRAIEELADES